jgi:hypothetical protein
VAGDEFSKGELVVMGQELVEELAIRLVGQGAGSEEGFQVSGQAWEVVSDHCFRSARFELDDDQSTAPTGAADWFFFEEWFATFEDPLDVHARLLLSRIISSPGINTLTGGPALSRRRALSSRVA